MIMDNFITLLSYLMSQSDYVIIGLVIVLLYLCLIILRGLFTKVKTAPKVNPQSNTKEKKDENKKDN